jgi:SRSO17 transposase
VRRRSLAYLEGLLSGCERKNGWQVSECVGDASPYGMQYLLGRTRWDADALQARLSEYVQDRLGCPDAVLILDETGFLKKGTHSAGVQRQYSGTAGRIENSQIGVFLGYAGERGYALLDRELYLPQSWAEDGARRQAAGIPDEMEFQTKPMLGRQMLERAFQSGVSCGWVAGDEVYGRDSKLRRWLEERRQPYVLAVAADQRLWRQDMRQHRVDEIANQLPKRAWKRLAAGSGAKGERLYDWALMPWAERESWEQALLVRRSLETEPEYAFYFTYARKKQSTLKTLVAVAGRRWAIESAFQMAKGECGLDHYEVRHWQGWYRHITLAMLALAVLAVLRAGEKKTFRQEGSPQRTGNPAFARFRAAQRLARPGSSSALV